jgi:hypothetical protein
MAAQAQIERINFLNFAVMQLDDVATQVEPLCPPRGQRSPSQLVDHLASLLDVQLSGNARTNLVEYVTSQVVGGNVVPLAFDPTNNQHLRMKVRGLLWQLGQYHDAHQE